MRLSRSCYDKPWRCPGWAGGGMRHASVYHCENGRIRGWEGELTRPQWRFLRCTECDVVTLPYALRWLDWRWLASDVRFRVSDLTYRRRRRQQDRRLRDEH